MKKEKRLRGIKGAIRVEDNSRNEILSKTIQLLQQIITANDLQKADIAAVFFTVTGELNSEFPAYALRQIGLNYVPALCAREIDVPGALDKVIRILVLAHSSLRPEEIKHQYLGSTKILRPDLAGE